MVSKLRIIWKQTVGPPTLASLALAATLRDLRPAQAQSPDSDSSIDRGGVGAKDSLHFALVLARSAAIEVTQRAAAVPAAESKTWEEAQLAIVDAATASAATDLSIAARHLRVRVQLIGHARNNM